jgi:hypothetical protein
MNFNYFVKVNIWKTKSIKPTKYRFTSEDDPFWKVMNLSSEENDKMSETWERWKSFYTFPRTAGGLIGRGTTVIRMYTSTEFPYETDEIVGNMKRVSRPLSLVFRCYIYPFPDTTLLYFHIQQSNIKKVILLDDETKNDSKLMDKYNFLPSKKNKKVLWYKKYCPNQSKFLYIYNFEPSYTHWKPTSEYICLPSNDKNTFPTLKACVDSTKNYIYNKNVYVQNSSEPLFLLSTTSQKPFILQSKQLTPSIFDYISIITLLIILIFTVKAFQ